MNKVNIIPDYSFTTNFNNVKNNEDVPAHLLKRHSGKSVVFYYVETKYFIFYMQVKFPVIFHG